MIRLRCRYFRKIWSDCLSGLGVPDKLFHKLRTPAARALSGCLTGFPQQFARNGALVRLINKFPEPPNKDVGEGLNTAFLAMQRLRLKPPMIEQTDSSVLVTIKHDSLASPEESVMDYLHNHETITNRIARQLTGIASENSMKEVFYRLAKSGLIARVPDRKGASAAWQKSAKP
jgi:ATP-dependent DNA helicase RecG